MTIGPLPPETAGLPATRAVSYRLDGWTPERQKHFLEAIADGFTVQGACAIVGLSPASAYALRRRAAGAAFALGWRAAVLVARDTVADVLLSRAIEGQVDEVTRPDGSIVTRHRYDNRLAAGLLARLDRQAEGDGVADTEAARLVAGEFDAYLATLDHAAAPAAAGLFLARRTHDTRDLGPVLALASADRFARLGAATADQVSVADCLAADRGEWTADQWRRAEAAGLVRLAAQPAETVSQCQHPQPDDNFADGRIWFDEDQRQWCTNFIAPPDFDGDEDGDFGDPDYVRTLTDWECAAIGHPRGDTAAAEDADIAERDRWFADYARQHGCPPRAPVPAHSAADRDADADADAYADADADAAPDADAPSQSLLDAIAAALADTACDHDDEPGEPDADPVAPPPPHGSFGDAGPAPAIPPAAAAAMAAVARPAIGPRRSGPFASAVAMPFDGSSCAGGSGGGSTMSRAASPPWSPHRAPPIVPVMEQARPPGIPL